ncbi:unnamed protein product [Pylaiella littoralis]
MSAISLDPETEQQRQPPAIGLRGAGAAFQVMGASVAKDAGNVFKVRKMNGTLAVSRAAKDGKDEGKKGGNRFSSSPCRSARIGKGKARELGEITEAETGHRANKRHNKNRSPVWRTGGKKNEEFMQEHRYGYQHGSGNRGDGDGGEGGRAGPPQKNGSDDDEGGSRAGPAVVDVARYLPQRGTIAWELGLKVKSKSRSRVISSPLKTTTTPQRRFVTTS